MINAYFATAFVGAQSVGVTIQADNIGTAFELAEDYLQERHPQSEVIVQAVQCINNEFTAPNATAVTPCKLDDLQQRVDCEEDTDLYQAFLSLSGNSNSSVALHPDMIDV
jgi:hypothetical protein